MKGSTKGIPAFWLVLLLTLILGALAVLGLKQDTHPLQGTELTFQGERVKLWTENKTDYYLFLPGYEGETEWFLPSGVTLWDEEGPVTGEGLLALTREGEYALEVRSFLSRKQITLHTLRLENTPVLFLTTATGTMEQVHADKDTKEEAVLRLYDEAGGLDYQTAGTDQIKGRGNLTWWTEGKKPYNLILGEESSLLGLGSGCRWVLLANALDDTLLRNEFAFELSRRLGLEYTPGSRFLSLYLNGEYAGFYQLVEKVELSPTRLNPETEEDSVLYLLDPEGQRNSREIDLASGQEVHAVGREALSDEDFSQAAAFLQEAENALLQGGEWTAYFDVDTWVLHYLVDELTENADSGSHSLFFYSAVRNGERKLYCGPVWDYDLSWGSSLSNPYPENFYARKTMGIEFRPTLYYNTLYHSPAFYDRLVELFRDRALPVMEELLDHWLEDTTAKFSRAITANNLRWGSPGANLSENREFLSRRVDFFRSVWLEGEEYCMVEVFFDKEHMSSWTVKKGGTFREYAALLGLENTSWSLLQTGEAFGLDDPVTEDLVITYQKPAEGSSLLSGGGLLALSLAALPMLGVGAVALLLLHRKRLRGKG